MQFANYINSRDFSVELGADDSPEGLKFVPAEKSPTNEALLLAACEVGGTVAVYELTSGSATAENMPIEITGCRYDVETEKLTADIRTAESENGENAVIAAIYNAAGALETVIAGNKTLAENESSTAEFDVSTVGAGEYTYKIMVWNSLSGEMPKAEAYIGGLTIVK